MLARAVEDRSLAKEIQEAAKTTALHIAGCRMESAPERPREVIAAE
ncbi:MAG: hypothetical protein AB7O70_02940 [Hyphomicrobiales bacterium]